MFVSLTSFKITAVAGLIAVCSPVLAQAGDLPAGMTTDTRKASELPGLQGFLDLPPSAKTQFDIYYAVKIKHASLADSSMILHDQGRDIPMHLAADGRISPMPTREQVERGDTITVVYPQAASEALKMRAFSTQPAGHDYDAQGLSLGIRQANDAMTAVGGILVMALPRLDRVYFVGSRSGSVETNGQSQPLPRSDGDNTIPAGTPYYVPAEQPGATRIRLDTAPSIALFETPPK